jgi:hypothetical protein
MGQIPFWQQAGAAAVLTTLASAAVPAAAEQPSLFRGIVVADSPVGVRVVSVEESSQAFRADLRPEDIIVRIDEMEINSIDEFATMSLSLRGKTASTTLLVFRRGAPKEVALHLYSYPVLTTWGVRFIPDYDLRFADPQVGLEYWRRLGRGFEEAGKPADALHAYLNALHHVPDDVPAALRATALLTTLSRTDLSEKRLASGISRLREAIGMLDTLFEYPLRDDELEVVRDQLAGALHTLRTSTLN